MTHLQLEVAEQHDIARVSLSGELDISEAPAVQEALMAVERRRPPILLLDLRGLTFLDSSGLRLILEADMRASQEGRRLAVVRGPDAVHRVFSIALLDRRLTFVDDPAEVQPSTGDAAPAPPA